jgi:bifunctional DNA-binding transcriptional regulator/antitoxin component of YhaV-PrlF toxin-antitoxin module
MRSTITARGQTGIPAPIRERFSLGPSQRFEWLVEADGSHPGDYCESLPGQGVSRPSSAGR